METLLQDKFKFQQIEDNLFKTCQSLRNEIVKGMNIKNQYSDNYQQILLELSDPSDVNTLFLAKHLLPVFIVRGCTNAGKSTFINALLGENILPVSAAGNTKAITVLRFDKTKSTPKLHEFELKLCEIEKLQYSHRPHNLVKHIQSINDVKQHIQRYEQTLIHQIYFDGYSNYDILKSTHQNATLKVFFIKYNFRGMHHLLQNMEYCAYFDLVDTIGYTSQEDEFIARVFQQKCLLKKYFHQISVIPFTQVLDKAQLQEQAELHRENDPDNLLTVVTQFDLAEI